METDALWVCLVRNYYKGGTQYKRRRNEAATLLINTASATCAESDRLKSHSRNDNTNNSRSPPFMLNTITRIQSRRFVDS